jgi:hypothetical protein
MTSNFDTGDNYTADAIRRSLAGETVESFVDPALLREAEELLKSEEKPSAVPLQQAA